MRRCGWGRNEPAPAVVTVAEDEDALEPADPLARLLAMFAREGAVPSGHGAALVVRLEERYALRIPDDFRHYLLHIAPLQDVTDDEITCWFSPDRVRNMPEELVDVNTGTYRPSTHPGIAAEENQYLVFADYMIWCWGWAVCCSNGPNRGRVALIGDPDGFVADSFTEFVERYLADPPGMANTRAAPWRESSVTWQ